MSGGELNYAYMKVDTIINDLQDLLDKKFKTDEGTNLLDDDSKYAYEITKHNTINLINKLINNRDLLKSLEWFLSGDNGFRTYQEEHREINLAFANINENILLRSSTDGE
jgi:hypothetical protein